jgi:Ion channel
MKDHPHELDATILPEKTSEFWSGDLGLTLVTISLVVLIFVIMPLERAGLPERMFLDLLIVALMIFGAMDVNRNRLATALTIGMFLATAVVLGTERFHSTYFLNQLGSVLVTVTLLLYARIVLVIMFRRGPITWRRIQGAVCAYLLLGLVWGSAFEFIERMHPGSFNFVTQPSNIDALSSKLTYFSFSALTTVGFGDVTPVLPIARSLAVAEAVVGQLFPAILIGALVAIAIQSRQKS